VQQVSNATKNHTDANDRPFHSWYQFVLGYPPHFVRHCLTKFCIGKENLVLDPFCGTGTTNVECKRLGIDTLGLEANPMAYFASRIKTDWEISPSDLETCAREVSTAALRSFKTFGLSEDSQLFLSSQLPNKEREVRPISQEPKLTPEQMEVLPKDFISQKPLRKVLILRELILQVSNARTRDALLLALANVTVNNASNLAFGPEIYTPKKKRDAAVASSFLVRATVMARDLESKPREYGRSDIVLGDARKTIDYFKDRHSVDCVITSPPYPNEKDYTRLTRLESIILGFIKDRQTLREIKTNLLRSNSRNIFVKDTDDVFVRGFKEVEELADQIEAKRVSLHKTSGFEKLYHRIVRHYFGGMFRHFQSLRGLLSPGAKLAYVVGDQASFFRINISTAELLGKIAEGIGYSVEGIELWRTRLATATGSNLNENILILKNEE